MMRVDMHDMFSNLKGIGWSAVALLAALFVNNVVFIPRRNYKID